MPVDKIGIHERRWFETPEAKDRWENRQRERRPSHVSPGCTLIAAMGNHWHPGCRELVEAMAEYTWKQGVEVDFCEIPDKCYHPFDALGVMRNIAYTKAIQEGWEHILYVDNDVLPGEDVLVKLLNHPVPTVSPIIVYTDARHHGLLMPQLERGKGLALATSFVLSFVLFRTACFFPWALGGFWEDPIGADEAYHFRKLYMAGHLPFVDTDVVVSCCSPPHYPLDQLADRPDYPVADRLAGIEKTIQPKVNHE